MNTSHVAVPMDSIVSTASTASPSDDHLGIRPRRSIVSDGNNNMRKLLPFDIALARSIRPVLSKPLIRA